MMDLNILSDYYEEYPPLMTDTCKLEILRRISEVGDDCKFFEFGSGGSTLFFSKYCKQYISIEHDKKWYDQISEVIFKNTHNVDYQYVKVDSSVEPLNNGNPPGRLQKYSDYIDYCSIINRDDVNYDIVFIDGVARQYCLYNALLNTNEKSFVLIHDYCIGDKTSDLEFKPEVFKKYYDVVSVLNSCGEGRGCLLTVLKPKEKVDLRIIRSFLDELKKMKKPL